MRLIRWAAAGLSVGMAIAVGSAQAPGMWDQPAATLADQIAGILGPGQARLAIRNTSSIPNDALTAIRKRLELDLHAHGITLAEEESANTIRVTLSENARERLWIAEVAEGSVTQVVMVELGSAAAPHAASAAGLTIRLQTILTSRAPVLAVLETPGGLVALQPEQIILYVQTPQGLREQSHAGIGQRRPFPRDPRGVLRPDATGTGFDAWLAGTECSGPSTATTSPNEWAVNCHASDDPWPVSADANASLSRAFYNSNRNYFTGIMTPSPGVDLPPFYSVVWIPRAGGGSAMIGGGIDGKDFLVENNSLKSIAGTRDWGSDFAAIHSGCGYGTQLITSSSGAAETDSLRAYELPALEAVPVSSPVETNGPVTALWTAPDGKSVYATVRRAANEYEVDRVSALCN